MARRSHIQGTAKNERSQPATRSVGAYRWQRTVRVVSLGMLGMTLAWSLLQPLDSTSVFDGAALPQNLLWLVLALIVGLDHCIARRSLAISKWELWLLLFVAMWMFVVTKNAESHYNPRTGWNGFWHILSVLVLYCSMRSMLTKPVLRSAAVVIVLGGTFALACLGLFQVTVAFPQIRSEYQNHPEATLAQLGIEAPEGSPMRKRFEDRLNSPEPYATFSLANSLAVLLSSSIVLVVTTLGGLLWAKTGWRRNAVDDAGLKASSGGNQAPPMLACVASLLIMLLVLGIVWFATRSRVAFAAVPVALAATVAGLWWQGLADGKNSSRTHRTGKFGRLAWIATAVAAMMGLGAGVMWLRDPQVFTEATKSLAFRLEYWQATLEIIRSSPWLGIGLGNFQDLYPRYMLASASETIADPHNWILDLASSCSLPVTIAIAPAIALTCFRRPTSQSQDYHSGQSEQSSEGPVPLLCGGGLGGLLVLAGLYVFGQDSATLTCLTLSSLLSCLLVYLAWRPLRRCLESSTVLSQAMAVTMLLCLMISGSWQAAGLLVPLTLCLAAIRSAITNLQQVTPATQAARATNHSDSQSQHQPPVQPQHTWRYVLPAAVPLACLALFFWHSWTPVLSSQAIIARSSLSIDQQLRLIQQAQAADPLNAELDRFRAKTIVDMSAQVVTSAEFLAIQEDAIQALNQWTGREPISFLTWQFAGDRFMDLAATAEKFSAPTQALLELARQHYERATQQRPNSAALRVQLAYCQTLLGMPKDAQQQLEEATKLSENTPHTDQKISAALVWAPVLPKDFTLQSSNQHYYSAELVVDWIRKQLKPG